MPEHPDGIIALINKMEPVDDVLLDFLPPGIAKFLLQAPELIKVMLEHQRHQQDTINKLDRTVWEMKQALSEYATQSGEGQIMIQNFNICLDAVRNRPHHES